MATINDAALRAETQGPLINSLALIFVAFSTIAVTLRQYTRKFMLDAIGPDDIIIACAQVLAIGVSVITVLEVFWGLGRHTRFVEPGDAVKQLKSLYAGTIVYNLAQILTKISFLIQYRRLFPSARIQNICFYLMFFIAAWGITQEFIVGFSCIPLTSFMPSMIGKCIYTLPVWYLTSCMNIVTDFMVFGIPVAPVLKLQMRLRQKLLLLCLFCLGFFTCIISLVRLSTLHKGINTTDPSWDNAPAAYWSVVELNCGIICACLPTLRPLIQKFIPNYWSTHHSSGRTDTNTTAGTIGLGNFRRRNRQDMEDGMEEGIIVQKEIDVEVEIQSTAELRSEPADYRTSVEETGSSTTYVTSLSREQN